MADWAIIRSGRNQKIEPIKLTDWEDYEWSHFVVLKRDSEIVWFDSEEEATEEMFEIFNIEEISPEYHPKNRLPNGYYLD